MTRQFNQMIRNSPAFLRREFNTLEKAVTFLEDDPWEDGSGFAKAELIRVLLRLELKEPYQSRLRRVVVSLTDKAYRKEFRWYCRLAWKADSPELRTELNKRLRSPDSGIRRRAGWMLDYLKLRDAYSRK